MLVITVRIFIFYCIVFIHFRNCTFFNIVQYICIMYCQRSGPRFNRIRTFICIRTKRPALDVLPIPDEKDQLWTFCLFRTKKTGFGSGPASCSNRLDFFLFTQNLNYPGNKLFPIIVEICTKYQYFFISK